MNLLLLLRGKWGYILLGGLASIALLFSYIEHSRAEHYQAKARDAKSDATVAWRAAKDKERVIDKQSSELDRWKAVANTATKAQIEAIALADDYAAEVSKQSKEMTTLMEKDHAKPSCAALMAADYGSVCPDTARWLRERARSVPGENR